MKIGAFLILLSLPFGLTGCSVAARHASGEVLELSEPWLYRWGDSPLDPDGVHRMGQGGHLRGFLACPP